MADNNPHNNILPREGYLISNRYNVSNATGARSGPNGSCGRDATNGSNGRPGLSLSPGSSSEAYQHQVANKAARWVWPRPA